MLMMDLPFQATQGGVECPKRGTGQLGKETTPLGSLQVKPCGETDVERRHQEHTEEPSGKRHVEAKCSRGQTKEEEEGSRPHYPQDKETETGTENDELPKIWCEDWWTPPVEDPEPATTLESCG
ncbi:hypothetical protein NDU88_001337 [Pleurodeles waltl]|uniref:Uncharacterized protein n=1 Tax=Pleurodeles waltl TaxID=8319 RepID=A0AAV7NAK5_PLEWA|nr:hypothetical protein NDU88_001337 [Pleurodeles waltl]